MTMKIILLLLISSAINKSMIKQIEKENFIIRTKHLVRDIVEKYGYIYEEYKLTTTDGYINTIYRIPGKQGKPVTPKKPIMLLHGIADTAFTFFHMKEKSIPFLLIEEGYDVWLPNIRGNYLSHDHKEYSYRRINGKYWDFSLDDLVDYDIPETIEFIKAKTGYAKISYIGHSQGTCLFLLSYMKDPKYMKDSIEKFIALGPVTSLANVKSDIVDLAAKYHVFLRDYLPIKRMFYFNDFIHTLQVIFAKVFPNLMQSLMEFQFGLEPTNLTDYSKITDWFYVFPGGCSKKVMLHWLQSYRMKKWTKFDFGEEKNLEKYGSINPPEYNEDNYKKWDIPSVFTYSENDPFGAPQDLLNFYNKVENKEYVTLLDAKKFNHIDVFSSYALFDNIIPYILNFLKN